MAAGSAAWLAVGLAGGRRRPALPIGDRWGAHQATVEASGVSWSADHPSATTATRSSAQPNTVALILFIAGGFILLVLAIAILARWRSTARAMSRPPDRRQSQRKRAGG